MISLRFGEKFHALGGACLLALSAACGPVGEQPLGRESEAVNVCDETVPSNRYVDGLPAYAQCSATTGSIWSNNGVDTAPASQGNDWVRTQQDGGYQCTEWAWRYMHFRWNVDYRHGDARQWCDGTLPATLVKSLTPVHGDLIVFDAGVCGADATTGHIAVIDTVDSAQAKVTIVEENEAGRRPTNQSCGLCFLHALANDGSAAGAAGAGGRAAGSAGASNSAGSANGGATARGGAPSFAGAGATAGSDSHATGGAFSMAGHGTGGRAQTGMGGATTSGGAEGGVREHGAAGANNGGAAGAAVSANAGANAMAAAGGSAGVGAVTAAGGGLQTSDDDTLPESANSPSSCQIGGRSPRGGAGWALALSFCLAARARRRRFGGRAARA